MRNLVKKSLDKIRNKLTKGLKIDLNNCDPIENQTKPDLISIPLKFRSKAVAKLVSSPFYKSQQHHEFEFRPQLNSTIISSENTDLKINTYSSSYCSSTLDDSCLIFTKPSEHDRYICVITYKAILEGDLSIKFSDQLKVICQNYDFSLVENIANKQHGFVPNYCIKPLFECVCECCGHCVIDCSQEICNHLVQKE